MLTSITMLLLALGLLFTVIAIHRQSRAIRAQHRYIEAVHGLVVTHGQMLDLISQVLKEHGLLEYEAALPAEQDVPAEILCQLCNKDLTSWDFDRETQKIVATLYPTIIRKHYEEEHPDVVLPEADRS